MTEVKFRDPVRQINSEYLYGLDVLSNKEFSLPGGVCRGGDRDPRHTHLGPGTAEVVIFKHLATIRHKPSKALFVVFKKTMDALLIEQADTIKYPKWLMDSQVKQTELSIYIHLVKHPYSDNPSLVTADNNITTPTAQTRVHKWLDEVSTEWMFDTVAFFLLKNHIINEEMYGAAKR